MNNYLQVSQFVNNDIGVNTLTAPKMSATIGGAFLIYEQIRSLQVRRRQRD